LKLTDSVISLTYSDRTVVEAMQRLIARTGDLTPASESVGEYMLGETDERFRTETDPEGRAWQPLSARTLAMKKAEGRIMKILQRTGLMRSRVNYRVFPDGVSIGIGDRKAVKHQLGKGVPARRILGINEENKREIVAIYRDYCLEE
jgi:phage virion morphogenesis protein